MGRYKKIPFERIAKVYGQKAGNVTATCASLEIDRTTFFKWKQKYPELEQMLSDVDESLIDYTESKLLEKIQDGNLTAIIFHLKTKGKKRGYVETVENKVDLNPFEELMMAASQVSEDE